MSDTHLSPVGVSAAAEQVYGLLLDHPGLATGELARRAEMSGAKVRDCLQDLDRKGLVTRSTDRTPRFFPAPPAIALGSLIRQQEHHLEDLRGVIGGYVERYTNATAAQDSRSVVEVVLGREAVLQRIAQIQEAAREEMLVFDRPPYVAHKQVEGAEHDQLDRGVRVRVIYERQGLETVGQLDTLRDLVGRGENARVLDTLPTKMMVADNREAVVPIGLGDAGVEGIVMVKAEPLVMALSSLFEALWRLAVPVSDSRVSADGAHMSGADRELLTLICTGMKDDAIARHLRVSRRTVQRRIEALRSRLGAQNRAHLIVLANNGGTGAGAPPRA